jgi:hypothetical protein
VRFEVNSVRGFALIGNHCFDGTHHSAHEFFKRITYGITAHVGSRDLESDSILCLNDFTSQ